MVVSVIASTVTPSNPETGNNASPDDPVGPGETADAAPTIGRHQLNPTCPWCSRSFAGVTRILYHARRDHGVPDGEAGAGVARLRAGVGSARCVLCDDRVVLTLDFDSLHGHFSLEHGVGVGQVRREPGKYLARDGESQVVAADSRSEDVKMEVDGEQSPPETPITEIGSALDHDKEGRGEWSWKNLSCPFCQFSSPNWQSLGVHALDCHGKAADSDEMAALWQTVPKGTCVVCAEVVHLTQDGATAHFRLNHAKSFRAFALRPWRYLALMDQNSTVASKDANSSEHEKSRRVFDWPKFRCPLCPAENRRFLRLRDHAVTKHGLRVDDPRMLAARAAVGCVRCRLCQVVLLKCSHRVKAHFDRWHKTAPYAEVMWDPSKYLEDAQDTDASLLPLSPPKPKEERKKRTRKPPKVRLFDCEKLPKLGEGKESSHREELVPKVEESSNVEIGPDKGNTTLEDAEMPSTTADASTMTEDLSLDSEEEDDEDDPVWSSCDGCTYVCPRCPKSEDNAETFRSLSAVKRHLRRSHRDAGDAARAMLGLRGCRVREQTVACKVCCREVVQDRIELGFHVWTEHGLELEVYARI